MSQTQRGSVAEAATNTVVGYGLSFAANYTLLPMLGFEELTAGKTFIIVTVYTLISFARSYILRRIFNRGQA